MIHYRFYHSSILCLSIYNYQFIYLFCHRTMARIWIGFFKWFLHASRRFIDWKIDQKLSNSHWKIHLKMAVVVVFTKAKQNQNTGAQRESSGMGNSVRNKRWERFKTKQNKGTISTFHFNTVFFKFFQTNFVSFFTLISYYLYR